MDRGAELLGPYAFWRSEVSFARQTDGRSWPRFLARPNILCDRRVSGRFWPRFRAHDFIFALRIRRAKRRGRTGAEIGCKGANGGWVVVRHATA